MKESASATQRKPSVSLVGAGSLAGLLAPALKNAGYKVQEIIGRSGAGSMQRARRLARKVGARAVTLQTTVGRADLLWLCVPDREIRGVARILAPRAKSLGIKFAFHSSGALTSGELAPLCASGATVASVHPLMTFVPRSQPSLKGVPFALEGDDTALNVARRIVRSLGGEDFSIRPRRKSAYHGWATMTSPLLLAYLVALEEAAHEAGLDRENARRMSLPIIRQTIANYERLGPADSFSGPFIRGDASTVQKHLGLLRNPKLRAVYIALAKVALDKLRVRNRRELLEILT